MRQMSACEAFSQLAKTTPKPNSSCATFLTGFFSVGDELRFKTAPDFESPTDLGGAAGDNVYEVSVLAGDAITLSTANLPTGTSFNPATGEFNWTPSESQQGSYDATSTAIDDGSPNPPVHASKPADLTPLADKGLPTAISRLGGLGFDSRSWTSRTITRCSHARFATSSMPFQVQLLSARTETLPWHGMAWHGACKL